MKITRVIFITAALFTASTFAQTFEVYGDYSYMQFNPTITGINSYAFNGGGGGAQWNIVRMFGIKGDFQGYGSKQVTYNVTSPIITSAGIIPVGTYKSNFNMFQYFFGPVVNVPLHRVTVFGEILFGQNNTNGYASLSNAIIAGGGTIKGVATQHPFAMAVGGGFDLNLNKHIALRLGEFDYLLTRFSNPIINTNNQNSFRYVGGVVFKFGEQ